MRRPEGLLAEDYCGLDADWLERRRTEEPLDEAGGAEQQYSFYRATVMRAEGCGLLPELKVPFMKILQASMRQ
ncbi:hypothetical protein ILYODFUR_029560 [Ilyodon furcidens]|uniref:Uncharacterized protein n=1 Tax=Ilyodon furcidens TaxID=33524 RepID=A0ABV0TYR4_9TELE